MNQAHDDLAREYWGALSSFLASADEDALQLGHELSKKAMNAGLGLLEMSAMQAETLESVVRSLPPAEIAITIRRCFAFFSRSLKPFEAAASHAKDLEVVVEAQSRAQLELQEAHERLQRAQSQHLRREILQRKEIHHRIKNNLQVISALLNLQSVAIQDQRTLEVLKESQNRVRSIALIHERLYYSVEIMTIDFAAYVHDLLASLFSSYGVNPERVAVHTSVDSVCLGLDTAIPCGLIVNELVSNALKHAFPPGTRGDVFIDLHPAQDKAYVLEVKDNGSGLPQDFDLRKTSSLGLKLVADLTRQLDGNFAIDGNGGTTIRITFAEMQLTNRG